MGPISRGSLMVGSLPSSSAKADDPVIAGPQDPNQLRGVLDAPLSRGMTRVFTSFRDGPKAQTQNLENPGSLALRAPRNDVPLESGDFRHQIGQPFGGIQPGKLNGTQVDFTDYRAGIGLVYDLTNTCSLDLGAGYSFQRAFDFNRAGEHYRTDPSPYIRLQLTAAF